MPTPGLSPRRHFRTIRPSNVAWTTTTPGPSTHRGWTPVRCALSSREINSWPPGNWVCVTTDGGTAPPWVTGPTGCTRPTPYCSGYSPGPGGRRQSRPPPSWRLPPSARRAPKGSRVSRPSVVVPGSSRLAPSVHHVGHTSLRRFAPWASDSHAHSSSTAEHLTHRPCQPWTRMSWSMLNAMPGEDASRRG